MVSWTYLFWVRGFGCPSFHTSQLSSRAEAAAWSPKYNFAKFPPPVAWFSLCSLLSFPTLSCTKTLPTFCAQSSFYLFSTLNALQYWFNVNTVAGLTKFIVSLLITKLVKQQLQTCPSGLMFSLLLQYVVLKQQFIKM